MIHSLQIGSGDIYYWIHLMRVNERAFATNRYFKTRSEWWTKSTIFSSIDDVY